MKKAACVHALHVGILTLKTQEFPANSQHLKIIPIFQSQINFIVHK